MLRVIPETVEERWQKAFLETTAPSSLTFLLFGCIIDGSDLWLILLVTEKQHLIKVSWPEGAQSNVYNLENTKTNTSYQRKNFAK